MTTTNHSGPLRIDMKVFCHLRGGPGTSRVELARQLSIAPSTAGMHVDRLINTGYLRERKRESVSTGRPPTIVELNPEAGQFIGIDLDARQVHGASVDFAQRPLRDRTEAIPARDSADCVIERIGCVIEDVTDRSRDLLGIGIAVPGTVDIEKGRVVHYRHIRGWHDIALADRISTRFGVPVRIENNARTMAFAERSFGLAKTTGDFICLCIRSGIGSGIFMGGKIHRGCRGLAGEIGGWVCAETTSLSGNRNAVSTLEDVASLHAILHQLTLAVRDGQATGLELVRNRATIEGLFDAVESGDRLVLQVLHDAANVIGKAVAQMSLLVDPDQIIISGPLAAANESFVSPLRDAVQHYLPRHHSRMPKVTASRLGTLAGALGASALAIQAWQPNLQQQN